MLAHARKLPDPTSVLFPPLTRKHHAPELPVLKNDKVLALSVFALLTACRALGYDLSRYRTGWTGGELGEVKGHLVSWWEEPNVLSLE